MYRTVLLRLDAMRRWMRQHNIEAYIVPTMDPHGSEYLPAYWQTRCWLSGFTGSAGTLVLTLTRALLWTDSRYWLQAEDQLRGTSIDLMRELVDPSVSQWLSTHVTGTVGYLPQTMPRTLKEELLGAIVGMPIVEDPFAQLWTDRPELPLRPIERMPDDVAGESAESKLLRLEEWMKQHGQDRIVVRQLSEIAWLLNLRGSDIPYNPFFTAYFEVEKGRRRLYINKEQLSSPVKIYLQQLSITPYPYEHGPWQIETPTPIASWRAVKNCVEREGFRQAHLRDGVAMVRFLRILDETSDEIWTELRVDEELTALRSLQPGFRSLSFPTIAAYDAHAAIVHYEATASSNVSLQRKGFLLLDSGAHYDCGTTDLTRTIALGPLSAEQKRVFTLVLKAHLQLQNAQFPRGTTGLQLDTAARMSLWRAGYDFGHGTGHGVGHCLGVHEGPVQIRKNLRADTILPLLEHQTITDEPGIYVDGAFGVRLENVLLCVSAMKNSFGDFLCFEPLTRCPYDLRAIDVSLLTPEERTWLNSYHALVAHDLMPILSDSQDRHWLQEATRAI